MRTRFVIPLRSRTMSPFDSSLSSTRVTFAFENVPRATRSRWRTSPPRSRISRYIRRSSSPRSFTRVSSLIGSTAGGDVAFGGGEGAAAGCSIGGGGDGCGSGAGARPRRAPLEHAGSVGRNLPVVHAAAAHHPPHRPLDGEAHSDEHDPPEREDRDDEREGFHRAVFGHRYASPPAEGLKRLARTARTTSRRGRGGAARGREWRFATGIRDEPGRQEGDRREHHNLP